jgi:hypothetical protein
MEPGFVFEAFREAGSDREYTNINSEGGSLK